MPLSLNQLANLFSQILPFFFELILVIFFWVNLHSIRTSLDGLAVAHTNLHGPVQEWPRTLPKSQHMVLGYLADPHKAPQSLCSLTRKHQALSLGSEPWSY